MIHGKHGTCIIDLSPMGHALCILRSQPCVLILMQGDSLMPEWMDLRSEVMPTCIKSNPHTLISLLLSLAYPRPSILSLTLIMDMTSSLFSPSISCHHYCTFYPTFLLTLGHVSSLAAHSIPKTIKSHLALLTRLCSRNPRLLTSEER